MNCGHCRRFIVHLYERKTKGRSKGTRFPRRIVLLTGLLLPAIVLSCTLFAPARPNILFITVDALRADHLESNGYFRETSPELSELAARGAYFANTSVQAPLTIPSLFIMMSGILLYGGTIPEDVQTLAELLKSEGYATAAFIRNPLLELDSRGLERGFDSFFCPESVVDPDTEAESQLLLADRQLYAHDLRAEELLERAHGWLVQNQSKQPFFLWVHLFDPHDPYSPPSPYDSLFDEDYTGTMTGDIRRPSGTDKPLLEKVEKNPPPDDHRHIIALYDGEIRYVSKQIGLFLDKLQKNGLEKNTLIVVSADHGESLGEHNLWGHGLSLYETELHIPLIMVMPGRIPAGKVITKPVESADIVPTILSLVGKEITMELAGKDLTPFFKNDPDFDAGAFARWRSLRSFRLERWKMITTEEGKFELYDLQNDPLETKNLVSEDPRLLRILDIRLQAAAGRRTVLSDKKATETLADDLKSLGYLK